jgi:hypothetical protein
MDDYIPVAGDDEFVVSAESLDRFLRVMDDDTTYCCHGALGI